jgi:Protein of unknown function DUF262
MTSKVAKNGANLRRSSSTQKNGIHDEVEVEDVDEASEVIPLRYMISSYGADYPVDGIVKRLNSHNIVIPTFDPEFEGSDCVDGFQRQFVWTKNQCDRFVESLLLGLPVPGIFLVKQQDGCLLVLDGQQRLRTLRAFYQGILRGKEFVLENVQSQYKGRSYSTLDIEDQRRLDDCIIHATIVRQEEPSDDQSSVYLVFERLNTGATSLQPQEIRVALYRGKFVKLLRELNENTLWRSLYGKKSSRLKDQELILRFFALFYEGDAYEEPMKDFLNKFMGKNRDLRRTRANEFKKLFELTCEGILNSIGDRAFRLERTVNAAVLDSVMVGVARRLQSIKQMPDKQKMRHAFESLLVKDEYKSAVVKSTADKGNVKSRLTLATKTFSKIL